MNISFNENTVKLMLHKSGINLEANTIKFIENNETITLFSAYLKLEELKVINQSKKINRIIVRWEIKDLCLRVSDIELYEYCLDNNISLYRNTRIHLKAFWNNAKDVFFGSANVTGKGIGEKGKYNYELNGTTDDLDYEDIAYFNEIIINSEYITSALFGEIKNLVKETKLPTIDYPKLETKRNKADYFLLSNLPMTESVEELYEAYCSPDHLDIDEINYVTHDVTLYNIPKELDESGFYNYIQEAFNTHPFIIKLKDCIKNSPRQSLNYGGVVRWIQENTTTVPTPRAWEIKQNIIVNILYSWIYTLDDEFYWNIPGSKSQVIYYRAKQEINVENFINNLNRDKARGDIAPHQIILLISIDKLYKENESSIIHINNLVKTFDFVWEQHQDSFKTNNNNLGMPLKVFVNRGYLEIEIKEDIIDFRNKTELKSKIISLKINSVLLNLFKSQNLAQYLKTRINL
jgi:hypothetical protein